MPFVTDLEVRQLRESLQRIQQIGTAIAKTVDLTLKGLEGADGIIRGILDELPGEEKE